MLYSISYGPQFFKDLFIFIVCVWAVCLHVCLHPVHVWYLGSQKRTLIPGTGCGVLGTDLGPLGEC